jgi:hypothetical protein
MGIEIARLVPVPTRLVISALALAITVAGCARNPSLRNSDLAQQERATQPPIRRVAQVLLAPLKAPDCEFKGSDPKSVDEDQLSRLKLEYERQCYKNAEEAARKRLRLLQTFSRREFASREHQQVEK